MCCAWPHLVRRKAEKGTHPDTRASPERRAGRPRAGIRTHERTSRSSLLKMGGRESFLIRRREEGTVKPEGKKAELSTTERSCTTHFGFCSSGLCHNGRWLSEPLQDRIRDDCPCLSTVHRLE